MSAATRSSGSPQMRYGRVARSNWGEGTAVAEYAVGDVVYVPEGASAVLDGRCQVGLHRVESCFSIGEDASFYYRLSPTQIVGKKGALRLVTDWNNVSDRLHVFPGNVDFTAGWVRFYTGDAGESEARAEPNPLPPDDSPTAP